MEHNEKSGFVRRTEDRRDYGSKNYGSEEKTPRPRRPRISRSQGGEKLFSSNDERRFIPAGERRSFESHKDRSYGDSSERRGYGSSRSYGDSSERRGYGSSRSYGDSSERRGYGSSRSYGDSSERRGYGSSRSYGDSSERRGYGSSRSYGDSSERRGYGSSRSYGDSSERRGYGEGRRYQADGERKTYGNRKNSAPAHKPGVRKQARPFAKAQETNNAANGINKMIRRKMAQAEEAYSDFDAAPVPVKEEIRLNKFIANSGICSRREADNFIQAGVVTVNGEVVTELGTKINIFNDDVRFNGERLKGEKKVYIVMNKPKGYVTTTSDPHAEKTVMELLKGCKSRVFSVGRLDKNTTGVLMFTNDGEMAEKLTHPSYNKKKIYQVTLNSDLSQEDYEKILGGVTLTDGDIAADELEFIDETDHRKLGIEIHSGKNRIVRRIFESLGYEVKSLDRVYFAGLTKKGLKKGQWRYLTDGEVNILKIGSYQ